MDRLRNTTNRLTQVNQFPGRNPLDAIQLELLIAPTVHTHTHTHTYCFFYRSHRSAKAVIESVNYTPVELHVYFSFATRKAVKWTEPGVELDSTCESSYCDRAVEFLGSRLRRNCARHNARGSLQMAPCCCVAELSEHALLQDSVTWLMRGIGLYDWVRTVPSYPACILLLLPFVRLSAGFIFHAILYAVLRCGIPVVLGQ